MCGIFGYVGPKQASKSYNSVDVCLEGLKHLEYRGYDSAGIAGILEGKIEACKTVGRIQVLKEAITEKKLQLELAIAHTRWATHGGLTYENAHPHFDENKTVAVVHNGIIENYYQLKKDLIQEGITFYSETDSEVIAQMIAHEYKGDFLEAVQKTIHQLRGSFAIAVIHQNHPDLLIASAKDCPLVIGIDKNTHESYVSSDTNAFTGKDLEVMYLKDEEIAFIKHDSVTIFNAVGKKIKKATEKLGLEYQLISKNGYEHFMLKEIFEQPLTIRQTLENRFSEDFGTAFFNDVEITSQEFQSAHHILILGCGTSWHAGCIAASMLENIARIPTQAEIASEFRYTNPIVSENTLVIAISQSGETADTLAAVREVKAKGAKILGICNVKNSSLSRESDSCLYLRAGPEISVCSTKAFTSQLALLGLFTLHMARLRHMEKEQGKVFLNHINNLPMMVEKILMQSKTIEKFAKKYAQFEHFFFLGRRYMYQTALEAALKLKEISYLNAQGYPAGEMKHGPIALISPKLAVIGMCGNKLTQEKMLSNLMEVKSRGAPILAFAPSGFQQIKMVTEDVVWMPDDISDEMACIPYSVATQLFAYFVAKERNCEIDQPRNLAKSVTVE
jgi:glucosamine--fructose-6-phosphate aminotransferase (isomerizing)